MSRRVAKTHRASQRGFELVPLSPGSALVAYDLERARFHGDLADRMIYATAVEQSAALVTADDRMTKFAKGSSPPITIVW